MNSEDLNTLFKRLRGSRAAMILEDALACYVDGQNARSLQFLLAARDEYVAIQNERIDRHSSHLATSGEQHGSHESNAANSSRRESRVRDILGEFDRLILVLQTLVEQEPGDLAEFDIHSSASHSFDSVASECCSSVSCGSEQPVEGCSGEPVRIDQLTEEFLNEFKSAENDDQFQVVRKFFRVREVNADSDILPDALYYVRAGGKSLLIRTMPRLLYRGLIMMEGAVDGRIMKPHARDLFLKLGRKRQLVLLTIR